MNALLRKLSGGDLRSDGRANEVAEEVIRNPELLEQLLEGLDEPDDLVRARTVHVMERISRTNQGGYSAKSCRDSSVYPRATGSRWSDGTWP